MHPNANKENTSTSNVQQNFVRITRSRAKKALGGVSIPPTKPSFKQQKRRAVLKDVSNTSAENIYSDLLGGGNIKVSKKCLKEPKKSVLDCAEEDGYGVMDFLQVADIEGSYQVISSCIAETVSLQSLQRSIWRIISSLIAL